MEMVKKSAKSIDFGSFQHWRDETQQPIAEGGVSSGNVEKKRKHRRRPLHQTISTDVDQTTRIKLYIDALIAAKRDELAQEDTTGGVDLKEKTLSDFDCAVDEFNAAISLILSNSDTYFTRKNSDDEQALQRIDKLQILAELYQRELNEWERILAEANSDIENFPPTTSIFSNSRDGSDQSPGKVDAIVNETVDELKDVSVLSKDAMDFFVAQCYHMLESLKEVECVSKDAKTRTEDISVAINSYFNSRSTRDDFTPPPYMRR